MPTKRRSILVVDDDPHVVEMLALAFQRTDLEVVGAEDGLVAVNAALQRVPAAIVLDLMMPTVDGFSVCKLLRSRPATRDIPILMLTAATDAQVRADALSQGVTEFMVKPASPIEVVDRVLLLIAQAKTLSPPAG